MEDEETITISKREYLRLDIALRVALHQAADLIEGMDYETLVGLVSANAHRKVKKMSPAAVNKRVAQLQEIGLFKD